MPSPWRCDASAVRARGVVTLVVARGRLFAWGAPVEPARWVGCRSRTWWGVFTLHGVPPFEPERWVGCRARMWWGVFTLHGVPPIEPECCVGCRARTWWGVFTLHGVPPIEPERWVGCRALTRWGVFTLHGVPPIEPERCVGCRARTWWGAFALHGVPPGRGEVRLAVRCARGGTFSPPGRSPGAGCCMGSLGSSPRAGPPGRGFRKRTSRTIGDGGCELRIFSVSGWGVRGLLETAAAPRRPMVCRFVLSG